MNLENLPLPELKQLQQDVALAIAEFEKRQKASALAELDALADAKGFSLKELLQSTGPSRKRGPVPPKYRDPENPAQLWSGRGRKPKWFEAALKAGKTPEDLRI